MKWGSFVSIQGGYLSASLRIR